MTDSNENPVMEDEEAENVGVSASEITGGEEKEQVYTRTEVEGPPATTITGGNRESHEDHAEQHNEESSKSMKKKKGKFQSCNKWNCDDANLWRIYIMSFLDKQRKLIREDKLKKRTPADVPKFPQLVSGENLSQQVLEFYPLNTFNQQHISSMSKLKRREDKMRIWRRMRSDSPEDRNDLVSKTPEKLSKTRDDSEIWPGVWPCIKINLAEERRQIEKIKKRERLGILPCHLEIDTSEDELSSNDYADYKELGHARIPLTCPKSSEYLFVDRAAGENTGLVDGDYILLELVSKKNRLKRVYTDVCLRGLKGMHIVELSARRAREKTWKFCFYQAVVALLAKTQLRYKYASSVNVDYIYDHAWMLFVHMGYINIRKKQRLQDVVVYNYKYNVQLELVEELKEISRITHVSWDFVEKTLKKELELERKELMHTPQVVGSEKYTVREKLPVHKSTKEIEDWFDKLDLQYKNCIFRTTRFSLAFWKDDLFWYLYNPFRCDKFGFWNDSGYSCIVKFCSRDSLKRHLMILLLRAFVHEDNFEVKEDDDADEKEKLENQSRNDGRTEKLKKDVFTIQIFQMVYQCCKIHNIKLLQRGAPKPRIMQLQVSSKKIDVDACPAEDYSEELTEAGCIITEKEESAAFGREEIEKQIWLKTINMTWTRFSSRQMRKSENKDTLMKKLIWHQYYVEEEGKLFSLWGQVHINDQVFPEENRGKQSNACYVVCAGMTRLMAPECWSPRTLDAILFCGDGYYTSSVLEAEAKSRKPEYLNVECWSNYLSEYFKIGEFLFQAQVLPAICGKLYDKSNSRYLWKTLEQFFLKYRFGILTCENACLGIFKFSGAYYIFDAHSMGPPIFNYGIGSAYLLRATYFYKFITALILTIGSPECSQFALNPIEIFKILDLDNHSCPDEENHKKMCRDIKFKARCQ